MLAAPALLRPARLGVAAQLATQRHSPPARRAKPRPSASPEAVRRPRRRSGGQRTCSRWQTYRTSRGSRLVAVLGHLHWLWIPAAIVLEAASMAAFAIMLRRLLAAGGAAEGVRSMLATAYAANALSVSVPLAGGTGDCLHVPPLHPAGRRRPAGSLVAAGRRSCLVGRRSTHAAGGAYSMPGKTRTGT